jgi:hypothetical protein
MYCDGLRLQDGESEVQLLIGPVSLFSRATEIHQQRTQKPLSPDLKRQETKVNHSPQSCSHMPSCCDLAWFECKETVTSVVTSSAKSSPSWEDDSPSDSQDIPLFVFCEIQTLIKVFWRANTLLHSGPDEPRPDLHILLSRTHFITTFHSIIISSLLVLRMKYVTCFKYITRISPIPHHSIILYFITIITIIYSRFNSWGLGLNFHLQYPTFSNSILFPFNRSK